jgi:hypothetical protein
MCVFQDHAERELVDVRTLHSLLRMVADRRGLAVRSRSSTCLSRLSASASCSRRPSSRSKPRCRCGTWRHRLPRTASSALSAALLASPSARPSSLACVPFHAHRTAGLTSAQVLRTKISKLGSLPGINTSSSGLNEAVRRIHSLPDAAERATLTHAFESSLGTVWRVIVPVVAFGFLCSACAARAPRIAADVEPAQRSASGTTRSRARRARAQRRAGRPRPTQRRARHLSPTPRWPRRSRRAPGSR